MPLVRTRHLQPGDRLSANNRLIIDPTVDTAGSVVMSIDRPVGNVIHIINFGRDDGQWSFYDSTGDALWDIVRPVAPEVAQREIIQWL